MRWRDTAGLPNAEEEAASRPAEKTIRLDNGSLRVMLSATRPVVLGYELRGGQGLSGDFRVIPCGRGSVASMAASPSWSAWQTPRVFRCGSRAPRPATRPKSANRRPWQRASISCSDWKGTCYGSASENVREEAGFLLDGRVPAAVGQHAGAGRATGGADAGRTADPLGPVCTRTPHDCHELV